MSYFSNNKKNPFHNHLSAKIIKPTYTHCLYLDNYTKDSSSFLFRSTYKEMVVLFVT